MFVMCVCVCVCVCVAVLFVCLYVLCLSECTHVCPCLRVAEPTSLNLVSEANACVKALDIPNCRHGLGLQRPS